jgi:cytochrome c oxidase subunit 4
MAGDAKDFKTYVRPYLMVFGVLMLGTFLTVAASWFDFDAHFGSHWVNMTVGLLIAVTKASFVVLWFMHLISEKQLIYLVLGFTCFFFVGLMGLTVWAMQDFPNFTTLVGLD